MPANPRQRLIIFLFLISPGFVCGQGHVPLIEVLDSLEKKFDVEFSYAVDVVRDKDVPESVYGVPNLNAALNVLEERTGLTFQVLDLPYIAIIANDKVHDLQEICGYVFNVETGEPVENAVVISDGVLTLTDSLGYFRLKAGQGRQVLIRRMGYDTQRTYGHTFTVVNCGQIMLKPSHSTLTEVVITDFITTGIDKTNSGVFRLYPHHLPALPGLPEPDVLYNIQNLPGIQSINESISDINVRGGTHDQNLFLWNGIRVFQTGHFFGLISAFNPYTTQETSVVKSGSSAHLGEAVSGTFLIKSAGKPRENPTIAIGTNMLYADGQASLPLSDKVWIELSGRRSFMGLWKSPTYDQYLNRAFDHTDILTNDDPMVISKNIQKFSFHDVNISVGYTPSPREKVMLRVLGIDNALENREERKDSIASGKISRLQQNNVAIGLAYQKLWNNRLRTRVLTAASNYQLSATNFDVPNNLRLDQENKILNLSGKLEMDLILHTQMDLSLGYEVNEVAVDNTEVVDNPRFQRIIKEVNVNHALFGEVVLSSGSGKTQLIAGIRNNYFEAGRTFRIEPRVVLHHRLTDRFLLNITGEFKSQSMVQVIDLQNDFLGVEKRRWLLSNEQDVPIVKSKQFSAAISYHLPTTLVSLEGFIKSADGIITSSQGFQNQFQLIRSTGDYAVTGLEFLISKKAGPFRIWNSYNLSHNQYNFQALQSISFPSNLDVRHYVYLGKSLEWTKWQLSSGITWRTGQPTTVPDPVDPVRNGQINFLAPNDERLPNYFRWDISSRVQIYSTTKTIATLGFSLWNITNRKNLINSFYIVKNNVVEEVRRHALGITPNITFRIRFE